METGNLITVLVGVCFLASGLCTDLYMGRFIESARETTGLVVDVVYDTGSRQRRIYPVVEFRTIEGKEIVGRSRQHYNSEVGQTVQILYDTGNPEHLEIGTLSSVRKWRIIFTVICILFGFGICFIGIGLELGILNWRSTAYRR